MPDERGIDLRDAEGVQPSVPGQPESGRNRGEPPAIRRDRTRSPAQTSARDRPSAPSKLEPDALGKDPGDRRSFVPEASRERPRRKSAEEGSGTDLRKLSDTRRRGRESPAPESARISPVASVSPRGPQRSRERASEQFLDPGVPESMRLRPAAGALRTDTSEEVAPEAGPREVVRRTVEEGDRRHPWDERITEVSRRFERSGDGDKTPHRSGALVAPASPQMGDGRVRKPKTWPPADAETESRRLRASSSERREEPSGPGQSESVEPPARRGVEIEPRVIRQVERGRPASSQSSKPDDRAERTINVTIGRVEVRAAGQPAAPAPKKRRSEPPVMSLDEYLRQRRDGGNG